MKKFLLAVLVVVTILPSFAESQVVYFPAHFKVPAEVKAYVETIVKKYCKEAIEDAERITMVNFEVEVDEYDQGKFDYYYKVNLDVRYPTNDDDSDYIDLIVEEADIDNPNFPRFYLEGIKSSGGVCRK